MLMFCYGFSLNVLSFLLTGKRATEVKSAWTAFWVILIGLAMAAGGAYLVYKYRLRVSLGLQINI